MSRLRLETALLWAAATALPVLVVWGSGRVVDGSAPTAEIRLGDRLFRETRFAQRFAARVAGRPLGSPLTASEPVGDALSCAACHLSGEARNHAQRGVRAFCDFSCRSPLPARDDGRAETVRNTPALRDAALPRSVPLFLHYDGQYASIEELAAATLTGRSLGWLPHEHAEAVAHVARLLREDEGRDRNALEHGGGSYARVLSGTWGPGPDGAQLPAAFRLDITTASDEAVLAAVARLLAHHVRSLSLAPDGADARPFRSPYDLFLRENRLPERPERGESDLAYGRRLRTALLTLEQPLDIGHSYGGFRTHAHAFRFGALERRGLHVFLTEPAEGTRPSTGVSPGGVGACISCHAPPSFTDFGFHNVGASQVEYDAVHGLGSFATLAVPGLLKRNAAPDRFLPPSVQHPRAEGPFLAAPRRDAPGHADLGLWNVFANPDVPGPQAALRAAITARLELPTSTPDVELLPRTLGWMKTPTLRNLGHSAPYFHGGHIDSLEGGAQHYRAVAFSARAGLVRNAAPELAQIDLALQDLVALAAFLRALDEDPP